MHARIITSLAVMLCAGTALAQAPHGGHSRGESPGATGRHFDSMPRGGYTGSPRFNAPQWHGGNRWDGFRDGRTPRYGGGYVPRYHGSYGHAPRYYGYRAPYSSFYGYYGPRYYSVPYVYYPPVALAPYYTYEYVEPPIVYYEAPQVAQVTPPPPAPPRAEPLPPRPEPPAPQPMPAPRTFERFTLSAKELFEFDRAELRLPQPKLDEIASALNSNPQIANVRITGYTDRLGTESYNLQLSQRRADAVKSYLVQRGVAANRLTAVGRGEANPVVHCDQKNRAELIRCLEPNRRVEVEQITIERPR